MGETTGAVGPGSRISRWTPDKEGGVSLALLAGGASQRMGRDKALLMLAGRPLLLWMWERLAPVFGFAFVVARDPGRLRGLGLPLIADARSEAGSAVGIYSAVLASPTPRVLCVACDMPFVTPALLDALVRDSKDFDVYVPRHAAGLEPLCAVYSRGTAPVFERLLSAEGWRIDQVYPQVRTGYLDVSPELGDPAFLFMNLNTPEDLELANERVESSGYTLTSTGPGGSGWSVEFSPPGGPVGPSARFPEGSRRLRSPGELAARVLAFTIAAPIPTVSFVGKKKSGKTTVLVGVVAELVRRGYRVGVVKHDVHGFEVDRPGTDSYALRQAGAAVAGISSPDKHAWVSEVREERSLADLLSRLPEPVDLLLTEGFKREPAPKIEVLRRERSSELIASADELLALVSDQEFAGHPAPRYALDDVDGVADLLEAVGRDYPWGRLAQAVSSRRRWA